MATDPVQTGEHRPAVDGARTLGATLATMSTVSMAWALSTMAFLTALGVAVYMFAATARDVGYSVEDLTLWMELRVDLQRFAFQARVTPGAGAEPDADFMASRTEMFSTFARIEALQAEPDFQEDDLLDERRHTAELREDLTRTSDRLSSLRVRWLDASGDETQRLADEVDGIARRELDGVFAARIQGIVEGEQRDMRRDLSRISSQVVQAAGVLMVVVLATLLTSLLVLRRTANRLASGASGLVAAAARVGAGEHDFTVAPAGIREFDDVAAAFNAMSRRIQQAQEARVRAEKLAAIGQLAAGVGHELRNPLGAIRNALDLVKKRIEKTDLGRDAGLQKALSAMDSEGRACNKIVTDLLDFAREKPLQATACPLRPLVDAAAELVTAPEGVKIVNAVSEDLPVPDLDRDQFRQVLINLLQNAADAIPERREGTVRVDAEADGASIRLRISDDGTGIPEETLRTIFEPLYTTKKRGTGLGLAIVSTIVSRHTGTIEVESVPGLGTTFSIRIPLSQRQ